MSALSLDEAKAVAIHHVRENLRDKSIELAVLEQHTEIKRYGWILYVNSRAYAASPDAIHDMLVGIGPIVVRHNGAVESLSTAMSPADGIAAFERKHWFSL
jgi:hypothetical protein